MEIKSIEFIKSSNDIASCPQPVLPEYAFTGRSNVGKSSLINMLSNKKNLAKTSSTPGKTRLINHFLVNSEWYIVDLPGYGYAKASKKEKAGFNKLLEKYMIHCERLSCLFVLIDCRHEPQESDIKFTRWLGVNQVPFVIIFTKTDKLSPEKLKSNIENYKQVLLKEWEYLPEIFLTSSLYKTGREEILSFIERTNQQLKENINNL